MLKKVFFILLFIILTFVCAVASPWQYWNISLPKLFGVEEPERFSRLQVSSLSGELEIFIDGESQGSVGPEGSPFLIEDVKPGKRLIKLQRVSEVEDSYKEFEKLLDFYEGIDVVIAYELGPTDDFTDGHVISAFESVINKEDTRLNIYTHPTDVKVTLDGQEIGESPLEGISLDRGTVHKLKLEKKGYEPQEISILPEDETARENLKGYDINVDASLFLIPIRTD